MDCLKANYGSYFVQIIEPLGDKDKDRAGAQFEDAALHPLLPVLMRQFIHI